MPPAMTKEQYIFPEVAILEDELQFSLLEDSNTETLTGGDDPDIVW